MKQQRERLQNAKRIVVKVGSSTLTYPTGMLNLARIERLVRELADLANKGKEVILVSSGAVAAGMAQLHIDERPKSVPEKQALAAVGQGILLHIYEKFFAEYGKVVGQVLLTRENSLRHGQYINSRNALLAMLNKGIIPIINENDAVAVEELKIGDNDTLSATVATLVDADVLIILSDVDGVYSANPQKDKNAKLLSQIEQITPEIEQLAGGSGSRFGTGGMYTKILAAKIAVSSGVMMVIASGSKNGVLARIMSGAEEGTFFVGKEFHLRARKSWLAFGRNIKGVIMVDEGCEKALQGGSSLLPAGIISSEGDFLKGETVRVLSAEGREIARGIAEYDAEVLKKISGWQTEEIKKNIDANSSEEAIHRDNMVLLI